MLSLEINPVREKYKDDPVKEWVNIIDKQGNVARLIVVKRKNGKVRVVLDDKEKNFKFYRSNLGI